MSIRNREPRGERTRHVNDLHFHHAASCRRGFTVTLGPSRDCGCEGAARDRLGLLSSSSTADWRAIASYFKADAGETNANGDDCATCDGTGTVDGETCTKCDGTGKAEDGDKAKPFTDAPVKQSGTPPRKPKQGPPDEGARAELADIEQRIERVERHHGITPARTSRAVERHTPQKENAVMEKPSRLVDHGHIVLQEKGSPEFMDLARAYAAKHKVPLEVAMVDVARVRPELAR